MSKGKEYLKNTIILFVGNVSTQLISFLLIPLYTNTLLPENYGYIDLVKTYINLITPVLILQLDSALFRFLIDIRDDDNKKKEIIANSAFLVTIVLIVSSIIFLIVSLFFNIKYFFLIWLSVVTLAINTMLLALTRGNGHNKNYSVACILSSIITIMSSLVLILIYKFDSSVILISSILANSLSILYITIKEEAYSNISFKNISLKKIKPLLQYSIPMIPNFLSWWIVGLSDRTMITAIINSAANAIYSIAGKFSNLLNSIFSVFSMSWQEFVSMNINDNDSSEYVSSIFQNIFEFFIVISSAILLLLLLIFNIFVGYNYYDAYLYIPFLIMANLFSVLSGLYGGIYVAKKMTKRVAYTTLFSALINILLNLILIRIMGIYGASIATLISYVLLAMVRLVDIRNIYNVKLNYKSLLFYFIIFSISILVYYLRNRLFGTILLILVIVIYLKNNYKFLREITNSFLNKHLKK